ncbi:hypothetical protein SZ54_4540 [Rhizobium sp. UR51a]|nr:hypothetical protein SZ54_4540 [Rhizobium sp. UR51a]
MAAVLRQPLVYFRALRRKHRSPAVASVISYTSACRTPLRLHRRIKTKGEK